jgi:hypothetical protein
MAVNLMVRRVDVPVPREHVDPCPGTKHISISDLRGIAAYELLRYVARLHYILSPRILRCLGFSTDRAIWGWGSRYMDELDVGRCTARVVRKRKSSAELN